MDWQTEEVSPGFLASCARWLLELVRPRPRVQRRGLVVVALSDGEPPIAGALVERTWRGEWLTFVAFGFEGVHRLPTRRQRSFAAAQKAFASGVRVELAMRGMGHMHEERAKSLREWARRLN